MLVLHLQIQITGCYRTEANPTKTLHLDPSPSQHTDIPTHKRASEQQETRGICVCKCICESVCVRLVMGL